MIKMIDRAARERLIHEDSWLEKDLESGEICTCCEDAIYLGTEVVQVRVVTGYLQNNQLQVQEVLADDGDYVFPPVFFMYLHWEEILDNLEAHIEDLPPVADDFGDFTCSRCKSDIRTGERFLIAEFGELRPSKRQPDAEHVAITFYKIGSPNIVCLACYSFIHQYDDDFWNEVPTQKGECVEGAFTRCYRNEQECPCSERAKKYL